jgi:site-specific recombinase XerD
MPVVKLTQSFIANQLICPPEKQRIEYCDHDHPGLYIEVRATRQNQGTYYWRYKDANGKTCHQKIGRTADLDLAEARRRAKTLRAEISLGADPRGDEKARLAVLTFNAFFYDHYLPYVTPRKRSWKRDEELYRLRIADVFGNKRLNQVTRQQIQSFHTNLKQEGLAAATANHHVKLLRHALNLAVEWAMLDKNPALRIPLFTEDNKVEHYLDQDELERLVTVLQTDENRTVCLIAMFLLSTGARLNEALQATWDQMDRVNRVWRIPARNSKSKRVRSVPLNDSAIDVLNQLTTEEKFDFLFVNLETEKPYTTIAKVWTRLRNKAGLPHLRCHDLRHQYASFLVNSGRTLYEVQQILGHSDPTVTQRYAHLSTKSLQEAAESASVMIKGAFQASA